MRILNGIATGAFLALSLASSGFAAEDTPRANTVLATVDGVDVTLGHVIALRARLPEQYQTLEDAVLFPAIVDQLIQQTVLMNAIKGKLSDQLATSLENEKRAFLASEMMQQISQKVPSEADVLAAYEDQYASMLPDPEFDASHILVATEAEALELVKLLEDGADFAELAKEKSTGPSGPSGGSLGWFGKGAMVPAFEEAVQKLAVGEISPPVQTQFGWHVLRLNDLRSKPVPTLQEVQVQLLTDLQTQSLEAEITRLTEAADVVRAEVDIDPTMMRDVSLFDQ